MRSVVLGFVTALVVLAQLPYRSGRMTTFQLESGVNVMATIFSESGSESDEVRFGKLEWKGNVVNRTLVLRDGTPWFGYSLKVEPAGAGQLRVSVERYNGYPFFETGPEPRVVAAGSTVELDVLENPLNGEKHKDSYQLSRGEVTMPSGFRFEPKSDSRSREPRDMKLPGLEVRLEAPRILRNGKPLDAGAHSEPPARATVGGPIVGFTLPAGAGRILLSWRKQERYGFEKTGVADDRTLIFRVGQDRYEIRTARPIAPADGAFYVWVAYDPDFRGTGQMMAYSVID